MRFLLYNIAYCTGAPRGDRHNWLSLHRYLHLSRHHVTKVRDFVADLDPDVVGLLEVDTGSVRARRKNQVSEIARALTHAPYFDNKYGLHSLLRRLPIVRHQGNAVLTKDSSAHIRHYFTSGIKRLILEVEAGGVTFFLVHLAISRRKRELQYQSLAQLLGRPSGPVILAGDFNTFGGREELAELSKATGLQPPFAEFAPTYPSWAPRHELDFILCSPAIRVQSYNILDEIRYSDHLPLLLDFTLSPHYSNVASSDS